MTHEGAHLDPENWDEFSRDMHKLMDQCLDRMKQARDLPWQPKPNDLSERLSLQDAETGAGSAQTFNQLTSEIMPYATGNTHPNFFGWVHGAGLPVSVGAELVAATMNSNCGGRDHGAIEVERATLDWLLGVSGMPNDASAILTTGTSQATILALIAARNRQFGQDVRKTGIQSLPNVAVYVRKGTHSCISKALEAIGYGSDAIHVVDTDDNMKMNLTSLADAVAADRAAGRVPLAVVGTAGSVNTGSFDELDKIADFCGEQNIWFHVDAAFGFWAKLADDPWKQLTNGMERANSISCDFHKWLSVPYDCGACMIYDQTLHFDSFTSRPNYLEQQDAGLGGGDVWYCDYGLELSRGFRALKVWTAIKSIGTEAFSKSITDNCKQANLMADLVEESDLLELAFPVASNVCCFSVAHGDVNKIAAELQLSGEAVFSTTVIHGKPCLRAALVNHRTTSDNIRQSIKAVEDAVSRCK
ncbi:Glutamate or tyrosine decarboxylase [Octadecabacter temperatus]|uniref:L-2,4-diaminobutyrate decarboxylase n=1 Tax=Octadecabacter temperatus TaxID=1458307 RepID=A0A0K0Y4W1_9RHOB|nr:pyridoxal-dependent decarboxylase [Octadecabacter temperatus]AKS46033.1 L-2,4-diaminobutyrate decarboxylase [Octadecabacter temperatus]SIO06101.1 Glutamate or tyrosine decarboxylase [Octadecabacter temperatus]